MWMTHTLPQATFGFANLAIAHTGLFDTLAAFFP
jgi:hypothetical protein